MGCSGALLLDVRECKKGFCVSQVLRRAFRYDWRLWTIPELAEMLEEAGFDCMRAWLRPMKVLQYLHST